MSADVTAARRSGLLADLPDWATMVLAGTALLLLLDFLRAMLPSLVFVYAEIGTDDAGDFTGFALVVFVTAALVARSAGINASVSAPAAALATAAARIALVAVGGSDAQLLLSSFGVVAAAGLLGAIAAADVSSRLAARGLALGFVVHTTLNAILRSQDALWFGGTISWFVTGVTVLALAIGWRGTLPSAAGPLVRTATPWLIVGPILALHGILAGTAAPLRAAWGEAAAWTGAVFVLAHAVGYVLGRAIVGSFLRDSAGAIVLAFAALTAAISLGASPGIVATSTLLVATLSTMALVVAGESRDDVLASRGRRSGAVGGGMLLFVLLGLGYYVGYDTELGFPQGLVPASAAVLVGLVLFRQEARADEDPGMTAEDVATIGFAPFVALFVLMASTLSVPPARTSASLDDVRVMAYTVRMGFDVEGRFSAERLAAAIRAEDPDVVVLNEVDRGWAITGGHDLLEILANSLRMEHVFAPAADAIWGNAILSRHPILDPEVVELPLPDPAVMRRSALTATIDLGGGERLGVVATHLSAEEDESSARLAQAELLAELAREFELFTIPVVIAGDLNAEPGDPELEPLADFVDAVASAAGGPVATFPSQAPTRHIDHVLVSPGFIGTDASIVRTTASDHLPVAVTVRRQPDDR